MQTPNTDDVFLKICALCSGKTLLNGRLEQKNPAEIYEASRIAHSKFEALATRRSKVSTGQIKWGIAQKSAIEHGLASPRDNHIGPGDFEGEQGRFRAFTDAALKESGKLSPQQKSAKFKNQPAPTAIEVLLEAKLKGVQRPPVSLRDAAEYNLRDREGRATYRDISKQVGLAVRGIEEAIGRDNPFLETVTFEQAYAYRDSLRDKGNAISTIERRMNTVNAVLNHGKRRFRLSGWDNPFEGLELPMDDDTASAAMAMQVRPKSRERTCKGHYSPPWVRSGARHNGRAAVCLGDYRRLLPCAALGHYQGMRAV